MKEDGGLLGMMYLEAILLLFLELYLDFSLDLAVLRDRVLPIVKYTVFLGGDSKTRRCICDR